MADCHRNLSDPKGIAGFSSFTWASDSMPSAPRHLYALLLEEKKHSWPYRCGLLLFSLVSHHCVTLEGACDWNVDSMGVVEDRCLSIDFNLKEMEDP